MLLQVTPIVVTAPVMTLGTTMTHQFTSTAAPYPGGGLGVAETRTPRLRGCRAAQPTAPAVPGMCRPADSCRTDVGSQLWPQHHVGRHAVPAVGVEHARARMDALRVGAGCPARRL